MTEVKREAGTEVTEEKKVLRARERDEDTRERKTRDEKEHTRCA